MDKNTEVAIGIGLLALTAIVAFAVYRWRKRERVRRIKEWITGYLRTRYGEVPDRLNINCSDDPLWPVLVSFERSGGIRHSLQFSSDGSKSSLALLSEKESGLENSGSTAARTGSSSEPKNLFPSMRSVQSPEDVTVD